MAIMAAAAIVGGGGVAAGLWTATTIAMVGIGATVVGMVTKNEKLTKIGAGLSLGGAGAGMAGLGPAASNAPAGLAGEALGAAPETLAQAGAYVSPGEAASLAAQGIDASVGAAYTQPNYSLVGGAQGAAGAPGLAGGAPASAAGGLSPSVTSAPGLSAAGIGEASGISAWADVGAAGAATAPMPAPWYAANSSYQGTTLQASGSWWDGLKKFWKDLDSPGKLAVGQVGMGLVQGMGEGMMTMQAEDRKYDFLENERDYQRNNMSYVPNFSFGPKSGIVNSALRGT
jgi:hypothetical protein